MNSGSRTRRMSQILYIGNRYLTAMNSPNRKYTHCGGTLDRSRLGALCLLLLLILGCECDADQFGDHLWLEIPMEVALDTNVFHVGDTIWIQANFEAVLELNSGLYIMLDSTELFSEMQIFEAGGTEIRFPIGENQVVNELGRLFVYPLIGAVGYPVEYEIVDGAYSLRVGIILLEQGLYIFGTKSHVDLFQDSQQKITFKCDNKRRLDLQIFYKMNDGSAANNNYDTFLETNVPGLIDRVDKELFEHDGGYAFRVID